MITFEKLALLLQPFTPHLSEEMWKELGMKGLAINQPWPKPSKTLRKVSYKIAIQINGKTRQIIEFDNDTNEEDVKIRALNDKKIKKNMLNKSIKKIIFVPKKILNIVLV